MQNKYLILFIIILSVYPPIALADEINVTDADVIWNLTLDTNTNISHLVDEPGVMVVKYADEISYTPMEDAASVNHLVGEPGVMVVRYADVISYTPMEDAASVNHLVGEPGVMVVRYADVISYTPMEDAASVNHLVGEPGVMVVRYADVISYNSLDNLTSVGRKELDITIDYPLNGDLILNSSVIVNGTAFSPNEITNVTVNGIPASGTTSWSATVPLNTGINTITVEVTTNTSYSDTRYIQVFHYPFLFGDFNANGELDSGDVTILMRKVVGLE